MSAVERAARALAEADRGCDDDWWFYLGDVEIVLKAIREPDDSVIAGMDKADWPDAYNPAKEHVWERGIDAALADLAKVEEVNRPYASAERYAHGAQS